MNIEDIIDELDNASRESNLVPREKAAVADARFILTKLLHFKRTPEWSVSMLEDIADLLPTNLPNYNADEFPAWIGH